MERRKWRRTRGEGGRRKEEEGRRNGKKKRGGGGRRCVWVQRGGCRVTNEILVPFCLQYCRGCEEERGAEGRAHPLGLVVQFHRVGTRCCTRWKRREQSAREETKGDGESWKTVYTSYRTRAPLKNYLFLAAWTAASTEIPSIGLILTRAARRRA